MSFPRHREIFPSDGDAGFAANVPAHRLDEFPAGYSLAGCSPAWPASASPAGHQYAVMSSCRSRSFQRTANCVLTVCVSRGGKRKDSLSSSFTDRFPKQGENYFDVILANPPFKGSLDEEDVHKSLLAKVKTKKTELLFVALILKMLKMGGRSATIVPDGVLFGSSKAHQDLRKYLLDSNQLEAVISLPSGVFRPYAGVSTGILVFTKGGRTDNVFFCDVKADGFSLDDKRNPVAENDLPSALDLWRKRQIKKRNDRTAKAFFVSASEIRGHKYDLSINRYKEIVHEVQETDPPLLILKRMKRIESQIQKGMAELEKMLR